MDGSYATRFTIHNMQVIKRRNKIREPCNTDWDQDDKIVRDDMLKKVKCTPPYWKTKDVSQRPDCNKMQEFKELFGMTLEKYNPPCRQITKLSYDYVDYPSTYYDARFNASIWGKYYYVTFRFPRREFMETELVRAHDAESLIGNIGGYTGLCLGYSFLHLPYLMYALYAKYCRIFSREGV